jgi:hypothetical protein
MNKKTIISHVVALFLGLLGGLLGRDLSVFQQPVEEAAAIAVGSAEKALAADKVDGGSPQP